MEASNPKISVRHLWKVFGPKPQAVLSSEWRERTRSEIQAATGHVVALREVTFDVSPGETFVVMGLSGSGKSTLVRCLLRLIEPTAGEIWLDGQDVIRFGARRLTQLRRKKVGMVFQRFALLPHRQIIDNVAFGLEIQGVPRRNRLRRAWAVLKSVGLEGWENHFPHELSGGMQQRVGLGRALAADPEVLLMDEPFSALDPLIRREMQGELLRLQRELRKTIVFITHDLDEALQLGDRIAIMRDGEIVQMGTPSQIIVAPANEYVASFTKNVRKATVLTVASLTEPVGHGALAWEKPQLVAERLRQGAHDIVFVTGTDDRFLGLVTAQSLLDPRFLEADAVSECLELAPLVVQPDDSVESLLARLTDYDWRLEQLPVVDAEGKLCGQISRSTIRAFADAPVISAQSFKPQSNGSGAQSETDTPTGTSGV